MKKREEILDKYKWNVCDIYESVEDWRKDFEALKAMLDKAERFKGKLSDSNTLLQFYEYSKEQDILMDKVLIYVYLNHMLDVDNDKYNQMIAEVENLYNEFALKLSYVLPELNDCDEVYLEGLLQDERFQLHHMSIKDIIKHKPHILSHELEEVVTKVGKFSGSFSEIYEGFDAVDIKFDDALDSSGLSHAVTTSNFNKLMESRDRVLRQNAYVSFYKAYKQNSTTIANNYIGSVKKDCFFADVYKYDGVLVSNLENNDLTEKLYYNLIENVNKALPLKHRWNRLKKKIFGLDIAYPYDMGVPISKVDWNFEYTDACDIVTKALSGLGEDYKDQVVNAINNRWIDVYPTKNKDTGGCNIDLYTHHSFIMLNWEGTFHDVSALAHELGHAMHHYFIKQSQPYEYTSVGLFLAEIASTTNEVLLYKQMYKDATTLDQKLYILQEHIGLIMSALFGQTMFSEFEDYAHKLVENNQPITKEMLLDKYYELQGKYNGDVVERMEEQKYGFLIVPHFYRAYYVYTYATGITTAVNFAKQCENGDEGINNVRKFLSAGGSDYPMNILKDCGVDLETNEPYEVLMAELEYLIGEVEKLI